ncbi:auxin-responsive protein IAA1-like [Rhodamnia argentea]|uniref:Auxin-responsive protein n=1 Tax=Rhodamnia argentea TaxID=178133 RepID=A0A8B8QIC3_9MYRT|nr:auxin-responsive protein IAA1-like [Rhodamnia argentea]
MERSKSSGYGECDQANLKATELRLGLPGTQEELPLKLESPSFNNKKRALADDEESASKGNLGVLQDGRRSTSGVPRPSKVPIVGWPPVRSYRKNIYLSPPATKKADIAEGGARAGYVKVSMDGAPYLRKVDLKTYKSYPELLESLENMFNIPIGDYSDKGSDYSPTYEDKDGDWMLVGDVPWNMFTSTCKRLRIMRGGSRS